VARLAAKKQAGAGPLHYFNFLTCGPSMARVHNAAQAIIGPSSICK